MDVNANVPFQIFVCGAKSGKTITVDVLPAHTMSEVKYMILLTAGVSYEQHYAMYIKLHSKQLQDNASVLDCGIQQGDTLDVRGRGFGGAKKGKAHKAPHTWEGDPNDEWSPAWCARQWGDRVPGRDEVPCKEGTPIPHPSSITTKTRAGTLSFHNDTV